MIAIIVNMLLGSKIRHIDHHLDRKEKELNKLVTSAIDAKIEALSDEWENKVRNFTHETKAKILTGLSMNFYEIFESHINYENYDERSKETLPRLENDIMMATLLARGANDEIKHLDEQGRKEVNFKAKNNLAYFLALMEESKDDLEEAKKLAIEVLALKPNDLEVQETYVYVMVKCQVKPMGKVNGMLDSLLNDHQINENWKQKTRKKFKKLYSQRGINLPEFLTSD